MVKRHGRHGGTDQQGSGSGPHYPLGLPTGPLGRVVASVVSVIAPIAAAAVAYATHPRHCIHLSLRRRPLLPTPPPTTTTSQGPYPLTGHLFGQWAGHWKERGAPRFGDQWVRLIKSDRLIGTLGQRVRSERSVRVLSETKHI